MKQVKNYHSKKRGIVNFNLTIYYHISQGLNPAKIAKKYNLPISNITYYTKKLEQDKLIKKVGYGTWETTSKQVKNYYKDGRQNLYLLKDVRGHGFQFKLIIKNDLTNWNKRVEFLTKHNINYSLVGNKGSIPRIIYKKHKVWLCNKSIIVYYPQTMSFFGKSAKNSRRDVIHDFYTLIKSIERYLHANFKIRGRYLFKITNRHYSLIKNELAGYYLKEGKKLELRSEEGELWGLIDNSHKLRELETLHTETAEEDMDDLVIPFMNKLRGNKFILDEIEQRIKKLSGNQLNLTLLMEQIDKNIIKIVKRMEEK